MSSYSALVSLPAEIIIDIANCVPPNDISAFARACHTVHLHCVNRLQEHRALMHQWRVIKIVDFFDGNMSRVKELLEQVVQDPWIAHYIRYVVCCSDIPSRENEQQAV